MRQIFIVVDKLIHIVGQPVIFFVNGLTKEDANCEVTKNHTSHPVLSDSGGVIGILTNRDFSP